MTNFPYELPGTDDAYYLPAAEGPRVVSFDALVTTKARKLETGGDFSLIEMAGTQGTDAPPHSHAGEAEAFFILDGQVRVWVSDLEQLMNVGDFIRIPKGAPHKFRIESSFARFLCFITPGGFEQFFGDLGAATQKYLPPDRGEGGDFPTEERLAEVAEKFDWHLEAEWDPERRRQNSPDA